MFSDPCFLPVTVTASPRNGREERTFCPYSRLRQQIWESVAELKFVGQKAERPALESRGPPGGLFGIDQEVVTLRGPFGELRVPTQLAPGGSTLNHR